jgi:hypothetical protein
MMKKELNLSNFNVQELNVADQKKTYGRGTAWEVAKMILDYLLAGSSWP